MPITTGDEMRKIAALLLLACALAGCSVKYKEGFEAGYAQGVADTGTPVRADNERPSGAVATPAPTPQ